MIRCGTCARNTGTGICDKTGEQLNWLRGLSVMIFGCALRRMDRKLKEHGENGVLK
jgi:hypothetical protein